MTIPFRALFTALIVCFAALTSACSAEPVQGDLEGLWQSHEFLSAPMAGPVSVWQEGGAWRATMAGETVEAETADAIEDFVFSGGTLRLPHPDQGPSTAFWIQPAQLSSGVAYSTPVQLMRDGDAWRGTVEPAPDEMTLYLFVRDGEDDQEIVLRNPDRNIGIFVNLISLAEEDGVVTLSGRFRGEEGEPYALASGPRDGADAFTLTFPSLEQTYHFTRVPDGTASGFYPGGTPDATYTYHAPEQRDDGWPVADARDVGVDPAGLEAMVRAIYELPQDNVRTPMPHAILVARHGKLVLEQYFHGYDADDAHDLRSSSKSITTTMVGLLQQAGADLPVSTPVYDTLGVHIDDDLRRAAMTLEHVITMSSGLDCNDSDGNSPGNEDVMQSQTDDPDWWHYIYSLDMVRAPGTEAAYCSGGINLTGAVIAARTGEWLPTLVQDLFAGPLDFGTYNVNLMPTGEAYFGGGMHIRPRDFMKLGQLMLDDGVWRGHRLLPEGWVATATAPYFPLNQQHYGYGWWLITYPYEGREVNAFYSGGNGGQMVIVVPELDLVVMVNAGNYADFPALLALRDNFVGRFVVPAVTGD